MEKIILDCDPGHDDAIAILLAAANPGVDLLGITTVAGNHTIDNVTRNALSVCTVFGIEVPVAHGSSQPLGFADRSGLSQERGRAPHRDLDKQAPDRFVWGVSFAEDGRCFGGG